MARNWEPGANRDEIERGIIGLRLTYDWPALKSVIRVCPAARRVNCAPQRRRSPVGGGPTHVVVGKHGSYRAAWPGNRPGRSLGTRVRLGRAAILQVVTRVKLEQASKVWMWTPTRQLTGEGRAGRERNRQAPVRSTGVVSTACKKGDLGNWGRSGCGEGRTFNIIYRVMANSEVGKGRGTGEAG